MIVPRKNSKTVEEEYHLKRDIPKGLTVEIKKGQKVKKDTILASGEMACEKERIDISSRLGIKPQDSRKFISCLNGERVSKGDKLVHKKKSMMRKEKTITSPISGIVNLEEIDAGILTIMDTAKEATVNSGVNGTVVSVIKNKQVDILCKVIRVYPFAILGSNVQGELYYLDKKQDKVELGENLKNSIIVFNFSPDAQLLRKLAMVGVTGIIVGGINSNILTNIDSSGLWGMTICIVEGIGDILVDREFIKFITKNDGYLCLLDSKEKVFVMTNAGESIPSEDRVKLVKRIEVNDRVQILDGLTRGEYGVVKEIGSEYIKIKTDKGKVFDVDLLNLVVTS
ncbi:hypothetical protein ACFLY9_00550 [Patescibacteria group bacterium]